MTHPLILGPKNVEVIYAANLREVQNAMAKSIDAALWDVVHGPVVVEAKGTSRVVEDET